MRETLHRLRAPSEFLVIKETHLFVFAQLGDLLDDDDDRIQDARHLLRIEG